MKLHVSGLHMEVGTSLQEHCETSVKALQAYLPEIIDVNVALSKNHHKEKAEIHIHASQIHLRAAAEGEDYFQAVDHGVDKLLRQVEKYKGRLSKHRKRRDHEQLKEAATHATANVTHSFITESSLDGAPAELSKEFTPEVTRKNVKALEKMSVDEAVMQMDLLHTTAYVFINAGNGNVNAVNREEDGTIGWLELGKVVAAQ